MYKLKLKSGTSASTLHKWNRAKRAYAQVLRRVVDVDHYTSEEETQVFFEIHIHWSLFEPPTWENYTSEVLSKSIP